MGAGDRSLLSGVVGFLIGYYATEIAKQEIRGIREAWRNLKNL